MFAFVSVGAPRLVVFKGQILPSLLSGSNVMCRQSQCSVGSSVSSYLRSSSLNWEPARLRIPIWIIIRLLQGTVPCLSLTLCLHHSADKRPPGPDCFVDPGLVRLICGTLQSLHLFCIVALVQPGQGSRKCGVCLLSSQV